MQLFVYNCVELHCDNFSSLRLSSLHIYLQETLRQVGAMKPDFSSGRLLRTGASTSHPVSIVCFCFCICVRICICICVCCEQVPAHRILLFVSIISFVFLSPNENKYKKRGGQRLVRCSILICYLLPLSCQDAEIQMNTMKLEAHSFMKTLQEVQRTRDTARPMLQP